MEQTFYSDARQQGKTFRRNAVAYEVEPRNGFLHRNFTLQQFVGMRWQIERAEEQCIRAGRRVSWMLQLGETPIPVQPKHASVDVIILRALP